MNQTGQDPAPDVFNGSQIITESIENNWSEDKIKNIISKLKNKTCYGFDRVPFRLFKDGGETIIKSVENLFAKIKQSGKIPDIWRTSRIIPVFKKEDKSNIENYRPISNLCSIAKIYERCILSDLEEIGEINEVDITGVNQFGFKKGCGTDTLALQLQKTIAEGLDRGKLVGMISLDLSAAFDVVNRPLLFERLRAAGIQKDVIKLIVDWLSERSGYVECNGKTSKVFC